MKGIAVAALAAFVLGASGSLVANDTGVDDCIGLALELAQASQDAPSLSWRDQDGLTTKANSIADKLAEVAAALDEGNGRTAGRKLDDAYQKLDQFTAKLGTLAATIGTGKEKIDADDESVLREILDDLRVCMDQIVI